MANGFFRFLHGCVYNILIVEDDPWIVQMVFLAERIAGFSSGFVLMVGGDQRWEDYMMTHS
jgi:hypothetical protein